MKRIGMTLGLIVMLAAPVAAQEGQEKEKPAPAEAKSAEAPDKPAAEPATPAEPAAQQAAETPARAEATLTLAQIAVCESVEDRAPVGEAESFTGVSRLFCFTRIEGADTPTLVYHRWYVGDEMVNEIPINVKASHWRCWSQKSILPGWSGACRVEVATEAGDVLGTRSFTLVAGERGMGRKEEAQEKAAEAKAAGEAKAEEAKEAAEPHEGGDDHSGHDHGDD
jgi:hypothetical protein